MRRTRPICPACTALYEEARKGREWLEFLSPEPDVPEGLLEKILAQTGPGQQRGEACRCRHRLDAGMVPAFVPPVWQQPGFMARMRYAMQPRLLMTAAMAFFSIALTLNLTGVRLTSLRLADLRPVAVRSYMERQLNYGLGADRALLRPSAVCVRSGIAGAATAQPERE